MNGLSTDKRYGPHKVTMLTIASCSHAQTQTLLSTKVFRTCWCQCVSLVLKYAESCSQMEQQSSAKCSSTTHDALKTMLLAESTMVGSLQTQHWRLNVECQQPPGIAALKRNTRPWCVVRKKTDASMTQKFVSASCSTTQRFNS